MAAAGPPTAAAAPLPDTGAAAAGAMDATEFQAFYRRTARPLWAYLARVSGSRSLADDLTQEAFYRLLRAGFRGDDEDHRRAYLFRTATNLLRDHHRRRRELPVSETAAERPAPDGGVATAGLRCDLGRQLRGLRLRDRQLLWLAHVEGASHREIAGILGVREASVRPMLFRARQKMAALLRAEGLAPGGVG